MTPQTGDRLRPALIDLSGLVTPRQPGEGPVETFVGYQHGWLIDGRHGVSATLVKLPRFQSLHQQAWQVPDTNVPVSRKQKETLL